MVAAIVGGAIAFSISVLFIIAFSFIFTRYYQDKHDSEVFPTVVTITGLIFVLMSVAIVPVDIFIASSTTNPKTGEREDWADPASVKQIFDGISIFYYVLYSIMMAYCFFIIPFAYFFFEEIEENLSLKSRILGSMKYTIFTLIVMIIIFILGLFLKPGTADPTDPQWYLDLLNATDGVRALCFMVACLSVIGFLIFISYTAYGMTALPFGMIKGKKDATKEEMNNVEDDLASTKEKQRALKGKYIHNTKKMSQKDKREIEDLEKKERLLSRRSNVLKHSEGWIGKAQVFLRPFQVIFGIIFLLISLLIFISILLTSIDKAANSYCGTSCGFISDNIKIFNPMNEALVFFSRAFPLDYIAFVAIVLYFFFATMSGIMKIGIRFLWVYLYKIRRQATVPQGLLLTCMLLMLSLLCLNITIATIAPEYSSYGYQKYCNVTIEGNPTPCVDQPDQLLPCTIESPQDKCTKSAISILVDRISVITPFFGVIFFVANWLFLGVYIIGLLISICKRRKSVSEELPSDSDDD